MLDQFTPTEQFIIGFIEMCFIIGAVFGFYRATMKANFKAWFRQKCFEQEVARNVRRQANRAQWKGTRDVVKHR